MQVRWQAVRLRRPAPAWRARGDRFLRKRLWRTCRSLRDSFVFDQAQVGAVGTVLALQDADRCRNAGCHPDDGVVTTVLDAVGAHRVVAELADGDGFGLRRDDPMVVAPQ